MISGVKPLATVSALVLVAGSVVAGAGTGSTGTGSETGRADNSNQCKVVQIPGAAGVFDVTREVLSNGKCVCYAKVGPKPSASVAAKLADLLRTRECSDAPPAVLLQGGFGGVSSGALIAGGAAAAAGIAAAAAGGKDSPP